MGLLLRDLQDLSGRDFSRGSLPYTVDSDGWLSSSSRFKTTCGSPRPVVVPFADTHRWMNRSCGKCKHCRWVKMKTRANGLGFELKSADWAFFVTGTIAPGQVTDALEDQILNSGLPSGFLKRLRQAAVQGSGSFKHRGPDGQTWNIRFVQCGEKGERHGRCHYHFVIWGNGDPPDWEVGDRVHIKEWPWGHVNIKDDITSGVMFYLSHYMQKDAGKQDYLFSESKRVAIGAKAYVQLAAALVDLGQARPPDGFSVVFQDEVRDRKAILRGAGKRDFIRAFAYASRRHILDFVPMVPEVMRRAIIAAHKWQREKIDAISYREGVSLEDAELILWDQFNEKYFDIAPPNRAWRSEAGKVRLNHRRVAAFVGKMRRDLHRKASIRARARDEKPDELEARINRMVDRGEFVPRRLLPRPHMLRTYQMDVESCRNARARELEIERARSAGLRSGVG